MKRYTPFTQYILIAIVLVAVMVLSYVPRSIAATDALPALAVDALGARLVLQPMGEVNATVLAQTQAVLKARLSEAKLNGAFEVKVVAHHLEVNLMAGQDAPYVAPLMSHSGQIEFVDGGQTHLPLGQRIMRGAYPTLFTSHQVTQFAMPKSGDIFYRLDLNEAAVTKMAAFRQANPNHAICMVMDGEVLNCSTMYYWSKNTLEFVPNLSGDTHLTMNDLAIFVHSGVLPIALQLQN